MSLKTAWAKVLEGKLVEVHYDKDGNIIGTYFANTRVELYEFCKVQGQLVLDKEQKHPHSPCLWMRWYRYNGG